MISLPQGVAVTLLLRATRRLCADYRRYLEHHWPLDSEVLPSSHDGACAAELVLIAKTLAATVARVTGDSVPVGPLTAIPSFEAAPPPAETSEVPADLAALSARARSLYLAALHVHRVFQ